MDYSIREIDLADEALMPAINRLVGETFGGSELEPGAIAKTAETQSSGKSLYVAAYDDDKPIGFLAFMRHDFVLNDSPIDCYQCCWAATDENYRGKKIFQNLVNAGKEILKERGAAAVFAFPFPGPGSYPIFVHKLGFREITSVKWQCPNLPLLRDFFLDMTGKNISALNENSIRQNDAQLINLKKKKYADILKVEHNNSFVWGIKRSRKMPGGINLSYFDIGGVHPAASADIEPLFTKLGRAAKGCAYFQLVSFAGNSYNALLKRVRPAQTDSLVVFDLNLDTSRRISFNLFAGAKDVF